VYTYLENNGWQMTFPQFYQAQLKHYHTVGEGKTSYRRIREKIYTEKTARLEYSRLLLEAARCKYPIPNKVMDRLSGDFRAQLIKQSGWVLDYSPPEFRASERKLQQRKMQKEGRRCV